MRKSEGWHYDIDYWSISSGHWSLLHLLWAAVQVQTTSFPDWNCFPPSTSSTFGLKGKEQVCDRSAPYQSSILTRLYFLFISLNCFKCPLRLQLSGSRSCNCRSTLAMRSRKPRWGEGRQVLPNCTVIFIFHYVPLWMFNNLKLRFPVSSETPHLSSSHLWASASDRPWVASRTCFVQISIHWWQNSQTKPLQAQRCPTNL